jgi:hypothetical protein
MKIGNIVHRASADYRKHIVGGLFRDVFETAWSRASENK